MYRIVPLIALALALTLATLLVPGAARPDAGSCAHTDAVIYSTDTLLLVPRLHAAQSSCADYYVSSIPASDGLTPRSGIASTVRANGPQFHTLTEVRLRPWGIWVQQTGNSWYQAGVELRRRMVTAGFDVSQGDSWVVNEVGTPSSVDMAKDVFNDAGTARLDFRDFARGLYTR